MRHCSTGRGRMRLAGCANDPGTPHVRPSPCRIAPSRATAAAADRTRRSGALWPRLDAPLDARAAGDRLAGYRCGSAGHRALGQRCTGGDRALRRPHRPVRRRGGGEGRTGGEPRAHGLVYPVDFAARGSCSIGGNIATNAGGIRVVRYGNTREWIAGLKVVAGNGELLELNRGLIKNSSGYDFRQLMIGSEGTLGVVVEATLRLTDPPPPSQVMLLALPDMDALMEVFALFRARLALQAFEFFTDRALHHVLAHGAQRAIEGDHPYYVVTEFDAAGERQREAALAVFEQALPSRRILLRPPRETACWQKFRRGRSSL